MSEFFFHAKDGLVLRGVTIAPAECTDDEIAEFEKLVREGGKVGTKYLRKGIKGAKMLAFAYYSSELVGVGALKQPTEHHRKDVFKQSRVDYSPTEFPFELGYFHVKLPSKGIGKELARRLSDAARDQNVFAITGIDNPGMQHILKCLDFVCAGHPYASNIGLCQLKLFVRRRPTGPQRTPHRSTS